MVVVVMEKVVVVVVVHEGEVLQLIRVMMVVDNVTSNDTTTSH